MYTVIDLTNNESEYIVLFLILPGAGVHAFSSEQAELINEIISLASQGKTASCRKSNKRSMSTHSVPCVDFD
jgi:hypothetical protein